MYVCIIVISVILRYLPLCSGSTLLKYRRTRISCSCCACSLCDSRQGKWQTSWSCRVLCVDLSPFLIGRMFLREPSWKYSAKGQRHSDVVLSEPSSRLLLSHVLSRNFLRCMLDWSWKRCPARNRHVCQSCEQDWLSPVRKSACKEIDPDWIPLWLTFLSGAFSLRTLSSETAPPTTHPNPRTDTLLMKH